MDSGEGSQGRNQSSVMLTVSRGGRGVVRNFIVLQILIGKRFFFSDETQICIGKHSKVHVWGKDDEKWFESCLGEKNDKTTGPVVSVMFWGCITFDGVGTFVPVNGNINSQKYTDILEDNLWSEVTKVFSTEPWIFHYDNATPTALDIRYSGNRKTIFPEWYGQLKAFTLR